MRLEENTVERGAIFLCVFDLKCHKMKQFRMQIFPGGMPPDPLA